MCHDEPPVSPRIPVRDHAHRQRHGAARERREAGAEELRHQARPDGARLGAQRAEELQRGPDARRRAERACTGDGRERERTEDAPEGVEERSRPGLAFEHVRRETVGQGERWRHEKMQLGTRQSGEPAPECPLGERARDREHVPKVTEHQLLDEHGAFSGSPASAGSCR